MNIHEAESFSENFKICQGSISKKNLVLNGFRKQFKRNGPHIDSFTFDVLGVSMSKAALKYKVSKDRKTILAYANSIGTNGILLLLIGKFKISRYFKNLIINQKKKKKRINKRLKP